MVSNGELSTFHLKKDATMFNEIVLRVSTQYIELNGGYDFAMELYRKSYEFLKKKMGEKYILESIMHADQYDDYYKKYGRIVWVYHLHAIAIPAVEKEMFYPKNYKNVELRGKLKGKVWQVSHANKWKSNMFIDHYGKMHRIPSYSIFQDEYAEFLNGEGYKDIIRGEKKKAQLDKSNIDYEFEQVQKEPVSILKEISTTESSVLEFSKIYENEKQIELMCGTSKNNNLTIDTKNSDIDLIIRQAKQRSSTICCENLKKTEFEK